MIKFYWKIIRFLAKDEYEFKARYLPAFIFTIALLTSCYYKLNIQQFLTLWGLLKLPLLIVMAIILSIFPKMISVVLSGYIQSLYFTFFGNPVLNYVKHNYPRLLKATKSIDENTLISEMKKVTRNDRKLISKNIFYGMVRNSIALVFIYLIIDLIYLKYYVLHVLAIFILFTILLPIATQRYAEQITESYLELKK